MADTDPDTKEAEGRKRSKLPLVLSLLGFVLFAAGGFAAAYTGLIPLGIGGTATHGAGEGHDDAAGAFPPLGDIAFVPVEPIVINIGPAGANRHLRFRAELEVAAKAQQEVSMLLPRIVDIINGYLRAVEIGEIEEPAALVRLRAQLLRRIQFAAGEGRVRDLLIMEFVLN